MSNISDYYLIEEYKNNYIFIGNYSLNIFNSNFCEVLRMLGIQIITPSIEYSKKQILTKIYGSKKISLNSCSSKSSSRIFVHDENINEINEIINNIINGNYYKGNDYINNIVVK